MKAGQNNKYGITKTLGMYILCSFEYSPKTSREMDGELEEK
jgi:hypothetical protein